MTKKACQIQNKSLLIASSVAVDFFSFLSNCLCQAVAHFCSLPLTAASLVAASFFLARRFL